MNGKGFEIKSEFPNQKLFQKNFKLRRHFERVSKQKAT